MKQTSQKGFGKLVLVAAMLILFLSGDTTTSAQKLYAMKMNAWRSAYEPIREIQGNMTAVESLLAASSNPAPAPGIRTPETKEAGPAQPPLTVLAQGLKSPDGLALRPGTEAVYVSEEDASRIISITAGTRDVAVDPTTPIFVFKAGKKVSAPALRMPEGIAFSPQGELYAVEDYPGGRLIRFTLAQNGRAIEGIAVAIPGDWRQFAWEGVAVSGEGELLIAGSTLENAMTGDFLNGFVGALLYRDAAGSWWVLVRSLFESFSAVSFSGDGMTAVYTCEVTGEIGWVDLRAHELRRGRSAWFAKGPEGVDALPDGRILVAEECGSIELLDPSSGSHETLFQAGSSIESVLYDREHDRLLVTADSSSRLLAVNLAPSKDGASYYALDHASYEESHTPIHIPQAMPQFLAQSLVRYAAFPTDTANDPSLFRQFAEQVPMIALNAIAVPADPAATEADPVRLVQFLVVRPTAVTVTGSGVDMPVAAFAVVTASGKIIKTTFTNMNSFGMANLGLVQRDLGSVRVGLPYPFTANVSPEGICNIHFSGLTTTPDYHFVLNPAHPAESYMVVDRNDGKLWQYQLVPPAGTVNAGNMVISYRQHAEQDWVQLGKDDSEPSAVPMQLTWAR